jgi:hypothetical protein
LQPKFKSKKVVSDVRDILEAINEFKNCGRAIEQIKKGQVESNSVDVSPIKDHGLVKRMNQTGFHPYHTKSNMMVRPTPFADL